MSSPIAIIDSTFIDIVESNLRSALSLPQKSIISLTLPVMYPFLTSGSIAIA